MRAGFRSTPTRQEAAAGPVPPEDGTGPAPDQGTRRLTNWPRTRAGRSGAKRFR